MRPGTLLWFARHEARLAWRDALMMLQGGRRGRAWWAALAVTIFVTIMHAVAYRVLEPSLDLLLAPDKPFLVAVTGSMVLVWLLLLSQGMETATRGFYARADLDLILSSPAAPRRLFAVRIGAIAATTVAMALLLAGPVIDVMAYLGGAKFLMAYGVLAAMGGTAASMAVVATAVLFRIVGAKRTRLLAQIIAAVVGAGFVVGVQAVAILSNGSMSRLLVFQSPAWIAAAPDLDSAAWWPLRAAMGDGRLLVVLLIGALALLGLTMVLAAGAFARNALLVASLPQGKALSTKTVTLFRRQGQAATLRRKEWTLLRRDPWLVSQSLMQVLYLLPPALMLWHIYGSDGSKVVTLVPVLVMAAGQLAGGLAWLAISGEDAPDLVATAPVTPRAILRAKIEAVLLAVALPLAPLVLGMACVSLFVAGMTIGGAALAAAGASVVQLIFRTQGKRSNFRRRQTASRVATFAEAFVSIAIAGAAGLAAAGLWLAVVPIAAAAGILLASHAIARPGR